MDRIKARYVSERPHGEVPQQRGLVGTWPKAADFTILKKTFKLFFQHRETSFILEFVENSISLCLYHTFNNLQIPSSLTAGFVDHAR